MSLLNRARLSLLMCMFLAACDAASQPQSSQPPATAPAIARQPQTQLAQTQPASIQPSATQPQVKPQTQPQARPPRAAPVVSLLDPGQTPHREIRFAPQLGQTQSVIMIVTMHSDQTFMGQPLPGERQAALEFTMQTKVEEITAEGDIRYSFKLTQADVVQDSAVPPKALQRERDLAHKLAGISGAYVVNNRGSAKQASVDIPRGTDPKIAKTLQRFRHAIDQTWLMLPAEPLGVGGRWQVVTESDSDPTGIRLKQTAIYEVASWEGSTVKLAQTFTQQGSPQAYEPPGVTRNPNLRVQSLQAKGTGEYQVNLAHVIADSAKVSIDAYIEWLHDDGKQQPQPLLAHMSSNIQSQTVEPKAP